MILFLYSTILFYNLSISVFGHKGHSKYQIQRVNLTLCNALVKTVTVVKALPKCDDESWLLLLDYFCSKLPFWSGHNSPCPHTSRANRSELLLNEKSISLQQKLQAIYCRMYTHFWFWSWKRWSFTSAWKIFWAHTFLTCRVHTCLSLEHSTFKEAAENTGIFVLLALRKPLLRRKVTNKF